MKVIIEDKTARRIVEAHLNGNIEAQKKAVEKIRNLQRVLDEQLKDALSELRRVQQVRDVFVAANDSQSL